MCSSDLADNSGQPLKVDAANGVIFGVKMLGNQSKNAGKKHFGYPFETRKNALPLYEGVVSNVDHHADGRSVSYRDRIGIFRNVVAKEDGTYGDFHFNPKHELAEQLCWDALHAPEKLGFSHIADGRINRKDPQNPIVEEITVVESVDLVANPATTMGLFESADELPDAQREFCEHALSAVSDARSIVLGQGSIETKKARLREVVATWQGELHEGEIADKIADDERERQLRRINNTAQDLICNGMYDDAAYPTVASKKARILAVLADWEKELTDLPPANGTQPAKEQKTMEWTDITVDQLKEHRQDLVEVLTGTDATSKLNAEVKTLKESLAAKDAELAAIKTKEAEQAKQLAIGEELKAAKLDATDKAACSETFMEQLKAAPDADARKRLIEDRVTLVKAIHRQPVETGAPLVPVTDTVQVTHDSLSGLLG